MAQALRLHAGHPTAKQPAVAVRGRGDGSLWLSSARTTASPSRTPYTPGFTRSPSPVSSLSASLRPGCPLESFHFHLFLGKLFFSRLPTGSGPVGPALEHGHPKRDMGTRSNTCASLTEAQHPSMGAQRLALGHGSGTSASCARGTSAPLALLLRESARLPHAAALINPAQPRGAHWRSGAVPGTLLCPVPRPQRSNSPGGSGTHSSRMRCCSGRPDGWLADGCRNTG